MLQPRPAHEVGHGTPLVQNLELFIGLFDCESQSYQHIACFRTSSESHALHCFCALSCLRASLRPRRTVPRKVSEPAGSFVATSFGAAQLPTLCNFHASIVAATSRRLRRARGLQSLQLRLMEGSIHCLYLATSLTQAPSQGSTPVGSRLAHWASLLGHRALCLADARTLAARGRRLSPQRPHHFKKSRTDGMGQSHGPAQSFKRCNAT